MSSFEQYSISNYQSQEILNKGNYQKIIENLCLLLLMIEVK